MEESRSQIWRTRSTGNSTTDRTAELSDWEHWGVSGIGASIAREQDRAFVSSNSDRVADLALMAAFQCLLQTLEIADIHLSLKVTDSIQALGKEFRETLDLFYAVPPENTKRT